MFGQQSLVNRQVLNPFADNLPGYSEIELHRFDLVDASIRKGPNSVVFGKFLQLERFRSGILH